MGLEFTIGKLLNFSCSLVLSSSIPVFPLFIRAVASDCIDLMVVLPCREMIRLVFLSVLISSCLTASLDSEKDHERVLHGKALSDKEHHDDLDHDYDHEAFLGDEAHDFDDLSPEESQRRLAIIVDKIDTNTDGYVSVEELRDWIKFTQNRYVSEDVEKQWSIHKPEAKETINWVRRTQIKSL